MQKIIPTLWFNFNAAEAVDFYKSVFKDECVIGDKLYYEDNNMHGRPGEILTIEFELFGQKFIALNGGPQFPFTDAISLLIECEDQKEIDYYWDAFLGSGGKEEQCGWIRDKYGLAWQVAPKKLLQMHKDKNKAKRDAVMKAMMEMIKLDINELQKVYDNA